MPISPEQCRAARSLLGWNQPKLAEVSGVSLRTIAGFEIGEHKAIPTIVLALQTALERAGVEFLPERGGKGVGVRLAKPGRGR